ncbi:MAG TPA: twin-arginine translocase TatA/TatE family subunit [Ignavibacteria bacterium]|nr:twin-arginine translocase TatA/TatE family subunit [Ignavibacteria bacterium]
MFGLGTQEIVLIVIVVLLLFGPKKIPEIMKGLGKGLNEFKKATKSIEDDIKGALDNPLSSDKKSNSDKS